MGQYLPPAEDAEAQSAFRTAEKKHQLHWYQEMRRRKGKLRGGKLRQVPTDLSGVLDFLDCSTWHGRSVLGAHSQVLSKEIMGLASHPGFFLIPGAISPEVQQRLITAALQEYPEALSNTNHTRTHGQLKGLWAAAQSGLSLSSPSQTAQSAAAPDSRIPDDQIADLGPGSHSPMEKNGSPSIICSISSNAAEQQFGSGDMKHGRTTCQTEGSTDACMRACRCLAGAGPRQEGGDPGGLRGWVAGGPGPPAAQLLRKLRWATLGPQFDWTARRYDAHAPYRPLPPDLRTLAVSIASAVARLDMLPVSHHADDASPVSNHADGKEAALQDGMGGAASTGYGNGCGDGRDNDSKGSVALAGDGRQDCKVPAAEVKSGVDGLEGQSQRAWEPDVALVNYYREGDTLGGHKDDAERNMHAPIVALSLGCDAIFLLGGETRDEDPVAMRIRGGDAIVMEGRARQYYHGIPRVFKGDGWPCARGNRDAEEWFRPFAQHMQDRRINISIRSAS